MTAPTPSGSGREITATRLFDAPRELVFDAWTDPKHISKWWGPVGFTTTTSKMDARTGGTWEHVMHGPDGTDYPNSIYYVEVLRPERIVYDHVLPPFFRSTSIFSVEGKKTRISVVLVFENAETRELAARKYGAVEGLQQTLARLGEHVATRR